MDTPELIHPHSLGSTEAHLPTYFTPSQPIDHDVPFKFVEQGYRMYRSAKVGNAVLIQTPKGVCSSKDLLILGLPKRTEND